MLITEYSLDEFIGKKIREKRLKLGLTLAEIGLKIGVSHQQIQKYEQGQSRISAGTLYQLAKLLGVNSDYFFDGFKTGNEKFNNLQNSNIGCNRTDVLNILVIEDDPSEELILRKAIEDAKQKTSIYCIHEGMKALEFLRSKAVNEIFPRPDIIILDLNLPKFSGHEILKIIKKDRELQDIPVIVITNSISYNDMINTYKNYASGYICKSFDFNTFKNSIIGLINYWSNVVVLPNSCSN